MPSCLMIIRPYALTNVCKNDLVEKFFQDLEKELAYKSTDIVEMGSLYVKVWMG